MGPLPVDDDDDDDAYGNALGLYRTYLGSLLDQPGAHDEEEAHAAHGHGNHGTQSPLSEDEQSVRSEEVQLYGQFMRSLITNEDDEAVAAEQERIKKAERRERNVVAAGSRLPIGGGGADDDERWNEEQGDKLIGKTVLAESPSLLTSRDTLLERDEWLARSLSAKKSTTSEKEHQVSAQELLQQDAKSFLPSMGGVVPKQPRSRRVGDANTLLMNVDGNKS
jgi:hypothetical protein